MRACVCVCACACVHMLIISYEVFHTFQVIIQLELPSNLFLLIMSAVRIRLILLTLPSIILWNPALMFHSILPEHGIICKECSRPMGIGYWNDGSSRYNQPRVIHDVDDFVQLVSAVYMCDGGHKLLARDESAKITAKRHDTLYPSPSNWIYHKICQTMPMTLPDWNEFPLSRGSHRTYALEEV